MPPIVRLGLVTPTLNAERYLERCLDTIWAQAPDGVEVAHVVVDGGSTDRTVEIARGYPSQVLTGRDRGMYDAINRGLASVEGDVLAYVNADDEIAAGALEVVRDAFTRHPGAGWLIGAIEYVDGGGHVLAKLAPVRTSAGSFARLGWCCLPIQAIWYRRAFLDRVGPFDADFRFAGDYDWVARALETARPLRTSRVLGRWRIHDQNLSAARDDSMAESERIAGRGPSGPLGSIGEWSLRVKVNARNPSFLVAKRTGRLNFWK